MGEREYEAGMKVRRAVLGDAHVDRATRQASDLDGDFQRWITETAWGSVWTRDHLDRRTKSLVTIAVLAALGHDELTLHLEAAENTGASDQDIAEVLFHVGVYAGVPQANRAYKMLKQHAARRTGERDGDPPPAEANDSPQGPSS